MVLDENTHKLDIRITRIEEQIKAVATQAWVSDQLAELTRTVDRMAVENVEIGRQIQLVSKGQQELYATHNALLKERAEFERQQQENQNTLLRNKLEDSRWTNKAKRWVPVVSILLGIVTLFGVVRTLLELWIKTLQQH